MPKLDLPKIEIPKVDLPKVELPKVDLSKIDLPAGAAKPVYAYIGATDLAVEAVKGYVVSVQETVQTKVLTTVAAVQKSVKGFELPEPKDLQGKATSSLADSRSKVEAWIAELQADAVAFPGKVQTTVKSRYDDNVAVATATYADLTKRGAAVVVKLRGEVADAAAPVVETVEPTPAEKAAATRAKKATATKAPAKKASATTTAKKAPAKKTAAKKSTSTTKSTTAKTTTAKTTAKKAPAKKAPAKKAPESTPATPASTPASSAATTPASESTSTDS
ncbi:hypothetical protein [Nocardioides sambongensis]|uniref:hypothetical protein n=1 Tax=Nocardioides sambongensis TaxID=2589074 RepID=UPI0015E86FEE|nr:hypothetical protein [Nocardioides sambongensis]